jgi:hypothetical protein
MVNSTDYSALMNFQVLMVAKIFIVVLFVTPCGHVEGHQYYEGKYRRHLQG